MNESFPDFYLAGAPKAGTTSLHKYFSQHPEIFVPRVKEPHFFACPEVEDTYYKADFVRDEKSYLELFNDCGASQLAGDCSPSYMYSLHAASRIYAKRPNAKIIAVLRDPTERAISHYLMDKRAGHQSSSLIECLRQPEAYPLFYREYVEVGRYAPQLERLFHCFGHNQVQVIIYEDLQADTEKIVRSMFRFLGVATDTEIDFSNRENISAQHRFAVLEQVVSSRWWVTLRERLPRSMLLILRSFFWDRSQPDFTQEREWLQEAFTEDIAHLEQMIDRDLGIWRQP